MTRRYPRKEDAASKEDVSGAPLSSLDSATFKENYKILEEVVGTLQQGGVQDVDSLLPLVERASDAYKKCKDRLHTIADLLKKYE